jgi:hypothetical protein
MEGICLANAVQYWMLLQRIPKKYYVVAISSEKECYICLCCGVQTYGQVRLRCTEFASHPIQYNSFVLGSQISIQLRHWFFYLIIRIIKLLLIIILDAASKDTKKVLRSGYWFWERMLCLSVLRGTDTVRSGWGVQSLHPIQSNKIHLFLGLKSQYSWDTDFFLFNNQNNQIITNNNVFF